MLKPPIGILGGTFDPVHHGHLRLALELRDALQLAEVRLIPNHTPPHRAAPQMDGERRAAWISNAIAETPGLSLDQRELAQPGFSYSVDTLRALRAELPDTPLCLILGMDAYAGFLSWREPREVLRLAHLLLVPRPGTQVALGLELSNLLAEHGTADAARLRERLSGSIYQSAVTPLAISAQQIRALAKAGQSARYLLPEAIWADIEREGLYK